MMSLEYKELSELFHTDGSTSRKTNLEKAFADRVNADSTFSIGFETRTGNLFLAIPKELSLLSEKVLRTERRVSNLTRGLPGIAGAAMLRGLVLDEVVSTNAIEDIHSTRRQIKDALEAAHGSSQEMRRFKELATLYQGIVEGTHLKIETPEDVRDIYDLITAGEIPDDKIPDGILFRKEGVNITQGGVKVIHRGLEPEEKIIEAMEAMLSLYRNDGIPSLFRAIAAHYIFEYAHPFYDGNGRTGRYLLSLMLSESLSPATALSLSRTIFENRDSYYKAFRTAENPLNHGELTFFVYALLEMIHESQLGIIERLEGGQAAFQALALTMERVTQENSLKPKEADALFMLMQYEVFGLFGDAPLPQIAEHLGIKDQMTRKYMSSLEEKGIVAIRHKRNPISFALSSPFKQKYDIRSLDSGQRREDQSEAN